MMSPPLTARVQRAPNRPKKRFLDFFQPFSILFQAMCILDKKQGLRPFPRLSQPFPDQSCGALGIYFNDVYARPGSQVSVQSYYRNFA